MAIAIVMAISVAYWAMGIGGSFTRFEKLQYTSAYAQDPKTIIFTIKNSGTATASVNMVLINGVPIDNVTIQNSWTVGSATMSPGQSSTGKIVFSTAPSATVELKLETSAGNQYPEVVNMP